MGGCQSRVDVTCFVLANHGCKLLMMGEEGEGQDLHRAVISFLNVIKEN